MLHPKPAFHFKPHPKTATWLSGLLLVASLGNVFGQNPAVDYATKVHPLFSGNGGCAGFFCHDDISNAGSMRLNVVEDSSYKEVALEIGPRGTRRVNLSNAANSLLLLLPAGLTPVGQTAHGGGKRTDWAVTEPAYNLTLQWIQEGAFRFLAPAPAVATVISSNRVDLSWSDKSNGEARFRIERKTGAGAFVFLANAGANVQSFSDNAASPNTNYTYNIRAENAAGNFLSNFATSNSVTTPPVANRAPTVISTIPSQTLIVGGAAFTQNLTQVFSDPDGDVLTFTAVSNPSGIVTAGISGSVLTVTALAAGSTTVTITANDGRGGATPTSFTVTVNAPTRTVRVTEVSGRRGSNVSIPIILISEGDENALGFSLEFDRAILSNPQGTLGKDATGALFNTNALQQNQGRFGISLALPTGQRFSAGVREIAVVTFAVILNTTAATTTIAFGDQPIGREIVNASAVPLAASYTPGVVMLLPSAVGSKTPVVPVALGLEQNYPNPFNPATTIKFSLPGPGHVTLKVYSLLGKEIAALVDRELTAGNYEARWEAPGVESGVYFYRLQSGAEVLTRKLILMR